MEKAIEILREIEVSLENDGKDQEANELLYIIWRLERILDRN